jgi:diguanylate cyclase (GGDEF)-like protein
MDLVARYGGEEFALVLPSCTAEAAVRVLARAGDAMRGQPALLGITVSAGVACMPVHADDAAGLVAAADTALYASTRAGRDRVTVAPAVTLHPRGAEAGGALQG